MIAEVRQQYEEYGIGRWAMIEKLSNEFIGWTGLKFVTTLRNKHTNYYDLGYRMIKKYWGKGYATESAIASVEYGFTELDLPDIFGMAKVENRASCQVLEKAGLQHVNNFYNMGQLTAWYRMSRSE
jgi:ribosomal-protein-alanine N-acetyltransferase